MKRMGTVVGMQENSRLSEGASTSSFIKLAGKSFFHRYASVFTRVKAEIPELLSELPSQRRAGPVFLTR